MPAARGALNAVGSEPDWPVAVAILEEIELATELWISDATLETTLGTPDVTDANALPMALEADEVNDSNIVEIGLAADSNGCVAEIDDSEVTELSELVWATTYINASL